MKMILVTIFFLQLVCSKHFLIETGDTNEAHRGTKERTLNYHRRYDFLGSQRAGDDYSVGFNCLGRKGCGKNKK